MNPRSLSGETVAGILADYKAGVPTSKIAAKYAVSDKTINRHTLKAGLRDPRKSTLARPPQPRCESCGNTCRLGSVVCAACDVETELAGGRWVPVGGIMRWKAA